MSLENNDLEMKIEFPNMTKYGQCKRDRVGLILVSKFQLEIRFDFF